jgi:type I restriction enzyme, S subunit
MDERDRHVRGALLKHACTDAGQYGLNVPAAEYVDQGIRLLRTTDLGSGSLADEGVFIEGPVDPRFVIRAGDLLLSRSGTVGQAYLAAGTDEGCSFAGYLVRFRPRASTHPRFLYYATQSQGFQDQIAADAVVSTIANFNADRYANVEIPLPGPDEQRRIADLLDDQVSRIDNIIAARREQMTLTSAMRVSEILGRLLMGGDLGGSAESHWYRGLPDGLPVRPLRAAWQVIDCKHRTPDYVDDGYPVVSPGDISPAPLNLARCHRFVDDADYADLADSLRRCRVGDIVYSRNASAGTAAIVTTDAPFTMGQDVCRITSSRSSQAYLYYALNFAVTPQLDAARVGSTFTRINIDEIKALRVPVPSEVEQQRIAEDVDRIATRFEEALAAQREQVNRLEELKRALITAAVTGEFDVSSADGSRVLA